MAATGLWSRKRLSLKGRTELCDSHIYLLVFYRLSILPLPCTILVNLEKDPVPCCLGQTGPFGASGDHHLHLSEGGFAVPNVETQSMTLRLSFLGRMWAQHDENNFRKKTPRRPFRPWKVYIQSADCWKMIAPSISIPWGPSFGCRLVSLPTNRYRMGH